MPETGRDLLKAVLIGGISGGTRIPDAVPETVWNDLCASVLGTDLAPLFFHSLQKAGGAAGGDALPFADRVRLAYDHTAVRNIVIQEEFLKVEEILRAENVLVSPLQGLHLIETVYGNPALRGMSDADVYVPRTRAGDACRALRAAGYAFVWEFLGADPAAYPSGVQFLSPGAKPVLVEVHWNLVREAGIRSRILSRGETAALAAEVERARVEGAYMGREMKLLAPEHFLLSMLTHLFSHGFRGEKWLWDVVFFIEKHGGAMDWKRFMDAV
ncbi:MAG: nucleotidyltransferase family protein, partial [bacterium]